MISNTNINELHQFAESIGLKYFLFDSNKKYPHYDLMKSKKNQQLTLQKALDKGAQLTSSKELIKIISNYRKDVEKMQLLDGKLVSLKIKDRIKLEVEQLKTKPCLVVIKVGNDPASEVYVRNKIKNCEYTGILSKSFNFDDDITEERLLEVIQLLNIDRTVNGILVQLPLPKHINKDEIIKAIDINKDVDCFHPYNIGRLYSKNATFKPCTPWGVIELLKHYNIPIAGQHCVIIGRSDIVGKPMAQLMLNENATVTIVHSQTKNIDEITAMADIIISAVGKAKIIKSYMINDDVVIVDVGINRDENGKLCGDVDFNNVKEIAGYISPVPGGVGLLTTTMLMQNTLIAYKIQNNL